MVTQALRGLLALGGVTLMVSCQLAGATAIRATPAASHPVAPPAFGLVLGQMGHCRIPPSLAEPTLGIHPAGTVFVLEGSSAWEPHGGGQELVLPNQIVTSASVPEGGQYRFPLRPGRYVLVGWYFPEPYVPGTVGPYANVSVVAGQTTLQDVPDPDICL